MVFTRGKVAGGMLVAGLVLGGLAIAVSAAEIAGTVTASRLNVRATPAADGQLVSSFDSGAKVRIVNRRGDWYEIILPSDAAVWVASQFVGESGEVLRRVNMRSGPGTEHAVLGVLEPGVKLEVLDRSRHGWLLVTPPSHATAWVSAEHVLVPNDAALVLFPTDPVGGQDAPPPRLVFIEGRERQVVVRGLVHPLRSQHPIIAHMIGWPSTHQPFVPYAYITSEHLDLRSFANNTVRIDGVERWVEGWNFPIVEVRRLSLAAADAKPR